MLLDILIVSTAECKAAMFYNQYHLFHAKLADDETGI